MRFPKKNLMTYFFYPKCVVLYTRKLVNLLFDLPEVLKPKDVSKFLNVSPRYAYDIMSRNDFPAIIIGSTKRVMREDFLAWVQNQKRKIG